MTVGVVTPHALTDLFRASMRIAPASVLLVTARDVDGSFHGMAVTSATSVSMSPPAMLVAVNRSASIHPIISLSGRFCLNLMGDAHGAILERFSRSDLRHTRFTQEHWGEGPGGLPVLRGALSSQICTVDAAHDYSTHTIFVGRVDDVVLPESPTQVTSPLIWMNGSHVSLAASRRT
jgi:flavin reductase (DIM6/NTAB) family NADH-FMN oxidoreductase RutF